MNSGSITATEKRVAKRLAALLPKPNKTKKVFKPLEGLAGCQNIWKEPKSFYTKKKVFKPLEGLAGCQNIWKEPQSFYNKKKGTTKCGICGEKGHNSRRCPLKCYPCADQTGRSYCFAGMTQEKAVQMAKVMNFESIYGETEEY